MKFTVAALMAALTVASYPSYGSGYNSYQPHYRKQPSYGYSKPQPRSYRPRSYSPPKRSYSPYQPRSYGPTYGEYSKSRESIAGSYGGYEESYHGPSYYPGGL